MTHYSSKLLQCGIFNIVPRKQKLYHFSKKKSFNESSDGKKIYNTQELQLVKSSFVWYFSFGGGLADGATMELKQPLNVTVILLLVNSWRSSQLLIHGAFLFHNKREIRKDFSGGFHWKFRKNIVTFCAIFIGFTCVFKTL